MGSPPVTAGPTTLGTKVAITACRAVQALPVKQIYLSLNQPVLASPHKKTPAPARNTPSPIGDAQLNTMKDSILIYLLCKKDTEICAS
jgi:hypothetical protein